MVDVGVTEHHGIQFAWIEGKGAVTLDGLLASPLKQTAFQQYLLVVDTQQIHGSGRCSRGPQKLHLHADNLIHPPLTRKQNPF